MRVAFLLENQKEEEKVTNPESFILSNRKGDYLWIKDNPQSRYEGWFVRFPDNFYRIIESVCARDRGELLEINYGFNYVIKRWEKVEEKFYLSADCSSLVYEISNARDVDIFFDVRPSYSSDQLVDYNYHCDKKNGITTFEFANGISLAVKCEHSRDVKKYFARHYPYDEQRKSHPFWRDVWHGATLYGKKFVFSVAKNKDTAVHEVSQPVVIQKIKKGRDSIDVVCAKNALQSLVSFHDTGIYAGFPWFFHFWQRDEAISLKSAFNLHREVGKDIFLRLLKTSFHKGPRGVVNYDAVGWLFKRAEDIMPHLTHEKRDQVKRHLKKYIEELLWRSTANDFAVNKAYETWMDSIPRDGARIEMQAMRLNMYSLARKTATRSSEKALYRELEETLKEKVRKKFFTGKKLYDGYCPSKDECDKTTRPNIFLAHYIYPELLTKKEWEIVFDFALKELWLDWGGVATISKNDYRFSQEHTGEDSTSYHQGDSWFFINNLTALALHRVNKKKYQGKINKIISASREEVLWMGAVGTPAEVTSAKKLESGGCINQAWSSATYLEAVKEIK